MMSQAKDGSLIQSLYLKSLPPNILAVLGGTINVLVDGILVGQKLGNVGLTAINQSLTVYLLLCTIGSLVASGFSAKSAIAMGNNQPKEAVNNYHAAITWALIIGFAFCAVGLIGIRPISKLLSTTETYEALKTYLSITLIGGVFKVLLYVPFFYLRLAGRNKQSAITMGIMMALNIVLDYLFLFPLNLGMEGAAWASVIATVVAVIFGYAFFHYRNSEFSLRLGFVPWKETASAAKFGTPMALNNVVSALRLFLLNLLLGDFALAESMVLFAMLNSINEFLICVQNGVPQTATAMTGIFWGEKDFKALRKIFRTQVNAGLLISAVLAIGIVGLYQWIPILFGSTAMNLNAFVCYAVSFVIGTFNSILFYYYSVTGRTWIASIITFLRIFFFAVVFCFLFCETPLVWLFFPLSEAATFLVICLISLIENKKKKLSPLLLLDPSVEAEGTDISIEVLSDPDAICSASEQVKEFCESHDFTPKKTMAVSLAVEEILTIINEKSLDGKGSMDLRFMLYRESGVLRIRAAGKPYNPIAMEDDTLDYLGVRIISTLATKIDYQTTLGLNTLLIYL